jgi:hypothetical protein
MMLRSLRLGTTGLIGFAIGSSLQEQFASCGPASNALGGFFRDSRKHLYRPSHDNASSMTINKYGVAVMLQTLAYQASAPMVRQYLKGHLTKLLLFGCVSGFTQYC